MSSRRAWLVPLSVLMLSCAHGTTPPPAPAESPRPSGVEPVRGNRVDVTGTYEARDAVIHESPCALNRSDAASCLGYAPNPVRRDSAARAFARGMMALSSAGVPRFATDHPTWDGRGVLIAILDSGIDPGIPGLGATSDGASKIMDLRDFSGEGRIRLQRAVRHGDTLIVGNRRLLGASYVAALSAGSDLWGGALAELPLGKGPAADINGNGVVGDTLLVIVAKTTSGWALFADTDGDGNLAGERPIHDYLVAHQIFGWQQKTLASGGLVPVPVYIAANIADSAGVPTLDLFFDTSSHGSHVTGIAAGHNLYGVAGFDGVAPGAKVIGLKIANDAGGGITVTGSMVRALDYAIRFAADRSMPLVVNLSFGVGNEREGSARIDAMIDSILAAHPDVVMTVAEGNDGPGLSTTGFPGSAARIISVGATLPPAFAGAAPTDTGAETVASFSSRGGEVAAPDIVLPGGAYSTVPVFAIGEEEESGTSMASPFGAGLAARLISALRASGHSASARLVRQSLRMSARRLGTGSAADQGAGLPDLERAWQWLVAPHDFAELAVDVGGVSGRAGVFLSASADAASAHALGTRVVVRRLDGAGPLSLRLRTDARWLQLPETVALTNGRGEFILGVQAGAAAAPGLLTAAILLEGPDETAGPLAIVPVLVRTSVPASGTVSPMEVSVAAGGVGRVFVPSDTGRGVQIEVATLTLDARLLAALHEPGGMPLREDREIPAGFGDAAGVFDLRADDVVGGVYELDVVAGPLAPIGARVSVRQSPLRLGATLVHDTLHVTARSLVATGDSVRIRAGLIGAERRITLQGDDDAPARVAIPVPTWAARMVVDSRMPKDAWSQFTDFGFSFLDRHGRQFDATPINYAFSRAAPELPDSIAGDTVVLLLSPAFADPNARHHWSLELTVRFYVEKPFAIDGDGSPFRRVAAGALREERFAQQPLPIQLPPEFVPLVTIVALVGTDGIWSREVSLPRAGGSQP